MAEFCHEHISKCALTDVFTLTYDRMRRYAGAWHVEREVMFPGYVFLETDDGALLEREVERYRKAVSLLGRSVLMRVEEKEAEFLRRLCGGEHHMGMSRGYIRDGQAYVIDGPLKGYEQLIRKIDRHKRMARLALPGRTVGVAAGAGAGEAGTGQGQGMLGAFDHSVGDSAGLGNREMCAGLEIVSKN